MKNGRSSWTPHVQRPQPLLKIQWRELQRVPVWNTDEHGATRAEDHAWTSRWSSFDLSTTGNICKTLLSYLTGVTSCGPRTHVSMHHVSFAQLTSTYESHVPQMYKECFQAYSKRLWFHTATKHALYTCCTFHSLALFCTPVVQCLPSIPVIQTHFNILYKAVQRTL